jgi:hypothetical protein
MDEIVGADIIGPRPWPARHVAHDYDGGDDRTVLGALRPCGQCGKQVLTRFDPDHGAMPIESCEEHN